MAIKFPGEYGNMQGGGAAQMGAVTDGELAAFVGVSGRLTGGAGIQAADVSAALGGKLTQAVYEAIPIDDWYFGGEDAANAANVITVDGISLPAITMGPEDDIVLSIVVPLPEGSDFDGMTSGVNPLMLRLSGLIGGEGEGAVVLTAEGALLRPWATPAAITTAAAGVTLDDNYAGRSVVMHCGLALADPGAGVEAAAFGPGCEVVINVQRAVVDGTPSSDANLLLTSAALLVPRVAVGGSKYSNIPDMPVPDEDEVDGGDEGGDNE